MSSPSHPLANGWTFYGIAKSKEDKNISYEELMQNLGYVETVEQFWNVYSHIKKPSQIGNGGDLHFFRGHCRAMREDPDNQKGGSFLIRISPGLADFYWEQLLLNLISNNLSNDINGVMISPRHPNYHQVMIWHKTGSDLELRQQICEQICTVLPFQRDAQKSVRIDYTTHQEMIENAKDHHTTHYFLSPDGVHIKEFQPKPKSAVVYSAVEEKRIETEQEDKTENTQ